MRIFSFVYNAKLVLDESLYMSDILIFENCVKYVNKKGDPGESPCIFHHGKSNYHLIQECKVCTDK